MPIIISGGGGGGTGGGAITQIGGSTLAVTAASFAFSNLAQTFNSLWLIVYGRSDNVGLASNVVLRLNGDGAANYDYFNFFNGSSGTALTTGAAAVTAPVIGVLPYTALTTASGMTSIVIPNYAGTSFYKTWAGFGGRKDIDNIANFVNEPPWGSWRSTAAVTALTVLCLGASAGTAQNFLPGSSAFLYGLT